MKMNHIGAQPVSALGYGCMRFPTNPDGTIDYVQTEALIDKAYQSGVNYFDTAYVYHGGHSEQTVCQILAKYPRSTYLLADKMPGWLVHSEADAERIFEEQLTRCNTSYFDFYLCHAMWKDELNTYRQYRIFEFLNEKRRQGVIRRLGFSFHDTPEVLEELLNQNDWDFVQIQLNYLDWTYQNAEAQYKLIQQRGIPCIVMEPVRGGALATLCPEAAEILKTAQPGRSVASWAIRFAAELENVAVTLSGMSNMEQLEDNLRTCSALTPFTPAEQTALERALACYKRYTLIPCTGCKYCAECPQELDIPRLIGIQNDYSIKKDAGSFLNDYRELAENRRAGSCIGCGQCAERCPQSLPIPSIMQQIDQTYQTLKARG